MYSITSFVHFILDNVNNKQYWIMKLQSIFLNINMNQTLERTETLIGAGSHFNMMHWLPWARYQIYTTMHVIWTIDLHPIVLYGVDTHRLSTIYDIQELQMLIKLFQLVSNCMITSVVHCRVLGKFQKQNCSSRPVLSNYSMYSIWEYLTHSKFQYHGSEHGNGMLCHSQTCINL